MVRTKQIFEKKTTEGNARKLAVNVTDPAGIYI